MAEVIASSRAGDWDRAAGAFARADRARAARRPYGQSASYAAFVQEERGSAPGSSAGCPPDRRIAKLQAVADDPAASEHERATALNLIAKLRRRP